MLLVTIALSAAMAINASARAHDVRVPFVGCKSDGQVGPLGAPKDRGAAPRVRAAIASRLAWYASNNTGGVFGPRGWHCFELYGSNGSVLMVTPDRFGQNPFAAKLTGPAIQLSISSSETSGRFEAAQIAARLFPNRRAFVESVIGEGIEPKADFVFGPFPQDRIHRLSPDVVAFETPATMEGMGTKSRLLKSGASIRGLVRMDRDNNATLLAVRLAPDQQDLAAYVIDALQYR